MREAWNKIQEGLDLKTIIGIIAFIFGLGVYWSMAKDKFKKVEEHETRIVALESDRATIRESLARIEGRLGIKK